MFRYTVSAITNIFEKKVCEGGKKIEGRVRFGSRIRHGAHKGPHRNGSNRKSILKMSIFERFSSSSTK